MRTRLVRDAIDTLALVSEVGRTGNGATVLFIGTVRDVNDGRAVSGMEYRAYEAMAARELSDIANEAAERFGTPDIVIEHRLGELKLGDASVAIAVAHPHRGQAYDANRYVIEQLKKRVPIWKLEHYVDGSREWVGAESAASSGVDALNVLTGAKDSR
ncbi:MAG: molybdenum cofactor biosynthesis protein MoaE [bacterium]